jgi:hypothetical protein
MSEEMASCTSPVEIFVPLLHEGTDVVRPTKAERLSQGRYRILPTPGYSKELEDWEFVPGTIVECRLESREGRNILVARKSASQ